MIADSGGTAAPRNPGKPQGGGKRPSGGRGGGGRGRSNEVRRGKGQRSGYAKSVKTTALGSTLSTGAPLGGTELLVADDLDFSVGDLIKVDRQGPFEVTCVDEGDNRILIASPGLTEAADQGDSVRVFDDTRGRASTEMTAKVETEDGGFIEATVSDSMRSRLQDGDDLNTRVRMTREQGEWVVTDVLSGRDQEEDPYPGSGGAGFAEIVFQSDEITDINPSPSQVVTEADGTRLVKAYATAASGSGDIDIMVGGSTVGTVTIGGSATLDTAIAVGDLVQVQALSTGATKVHVQLVSEGATGSGGSSGGGTVGPQGPEGPAGADGADGADGQDGARGSLIYFGNGAPTLPYTPASGLPPVQDGDAYLDLDTGDVYQLEPDSGGGGDPGGGGSEPTAPTLTVTDTTANSVSVAWTESIDADGIQRYEVYMEPAGLVAVEGPSTFTYTWFGASPDTTYTAYVRAVDNVANQVDSNTVIVTTPSDGGGGGGSVTPPVLTATDVTASSVTLEWTPATSPEGIQSYQVHLEPGGLIRVEGPDSTGWTDTAVFPNTTYTYFVRAVDNLGATADSNQVTVTTDP